MSSSLNSSDAHARSMLPKFKDCTFESDKNPQSFLVWIRLLSGIIRTLPGGLALERFLDNFLGRDLHVTSTRPAFLDRPELQVPELRASPSRSQATSRSADLPPDAQPEDKSNATENTADTVEPPDQNPQTYGDLSDASMQLDLMLFNILFTIVIGSYQGLIAGLTGAHARYTFGIIALWEHVAMGASNRRMKALSDMQELMYHGDAGKWKIDFLNRAREVFASNLTVEHFIMQCAFKSFEGKERQVQGLIVQDINSDDIKPGMNLDLYASKYSSFVATIDSGRSAGKLVQSATTPKHCTHCNKDGHTVDVCRKRIRQEKAAKAEQAQSDDATSADEEEEPCTYCNREGHTENECRIKQRAMKRAQKKSAKEQPRTSTSDSGSKKSTENKSPADDREAHMAELFKILSTRHD